MMKIPLFPDYSMTIILLKIITGMPIADFKNMWNTIWGLRGTPQNTVDWTNPDEWIDQRLLGKDKEIANKIWQRSNRNVNPRWTRGCQFLISGYNLISEDNGTFQLTDAGKDFVSNPISDVVKRIDIEEGLIQILRQLSLIERGKRADLLVEWEEYTKYHSNIKQDSVRKDYLRRRLANLVDRKYVKRNGVTYCITDKGLNYLRSAEDTNPNPTINKENRLNRDIEFLTRSKGYC